MRPWKTLALSAAAAFAAADLSAQPLWLSPLGPPVQVNAEEQRFQGIPALALDTAGLLTAVWEKADNPFAADLWARRFDAAGDPGPAERRIDSEGVSQQQLYESVVPLEPPGAGLSVAAWVNYTSLLSVRSGPKAADARFVIEGRLLGADGVPESEHFPISASDNYSTSLRLAALRPGGFVASWSDTSLEGITRAVVRRFDASGQPAGPEIVLSSRPATSCDVLSLGLGALADGGFAAIWGEYSGNAPIGCTPAAHGRRFDRDGQPAGPAFDLATAPLGLFMVRADGSSVVANNDANQSAGSLTARLLDPAGQPLGPDFLVTDGVDSRWEPEMAADDGGNFLVTWRSATSGGAWARFYNAAGEPLGAPFAVASGLAGTTGLRATADGQGTWAVTWNEAQKLFVRRFGLCPADGSRLCLSRDRFQAEVAWRNPRTGETGAGHAVPLTGDTGAFWFFGPQNLELMVKVLDGRAVNDRFWVFYGALSDVEYDLTVTDVVTGEQQHYHNPAQTLASHADTAAFAAGAAVAMPTAIPPRPALAPGGPPPCPNALCLGGGRFGVDVAWRDPRTGRSGSGSTRPLTEDTGTFWFFSPENLELMIKVLDGRAVNGHFWVFFGALSDVETTITVTDTATGAVRTYHNPPYRLASRADTNAF
jgi:hypothetical protein